MLFHPHIHVLVPAVGLAQSGCELRHPRTEEYLLPERALAHAARKAMNQALASDHPEIFARIEPALWLKPWVVQAHGAGRGRTALRYLVAYVKKSAFSEDRLLGHDQTGRIVLAIGRAWIESLKAKRSIHSNSSGPGFFTSCPRVLFGFDVMDG